LHTPEISVLRRVRQEDPEFKASRATQCGPCFKEEEEWKALRKSICCPRIFKTTFSFLEPLKPLFVKVSNTQLSFLSNSVISQLGSTENSIYKLESIKR
jgi:hypothetical protein